ncbi:hypothetical protein SKAU_G00303650 [Synaphobranchus kaupii]|uniref:Uncharacterized protein n=1 Tax=Synaphobranchus kaupii TaxID=118154 RepID=A0A9Q1EWC0_SYNKA|nr:hypothetical protein SKAU_G00303650 [Synaphobranchus kaupii]
MKPPDPSSPLPSPFYCPCAIRPLSQTNKEPQIVALSALEEKSAAPAITIGLRRRRLPCVLPGRLDDMHGADQSGAASVSPTRSARRRVTLRSGRASCECLSQFGKQVSSGLPQAAEPPRPARNRLSQAPGQPRPHGPDVNAVMMSPGPIKAGKPARRAQPARGVCVRSALALVVVWTLRRRGAEQISGGPCWLGPESGTAVHPRGDTPRPWEPAVDPCGETCQWGLQPGEEVLK